MPSSIARPAAVGGGSATTFTPPPWLSALWTSVAASDPGLLRLWLAMRGTLSVGLTATVLSVICGLTGRPITDFAFGVVFSMVGTFVLRDPTRRGRQITLVMLLPPAGVAVIAASLLHVLPLAGEAWFLALVFATSLLQPRHPRALGMGLIAVIMTYVGLYLRLPPSTLPAQLASLVIGAGTVAIVCFVILPLRPAATLRRAVRNVRVRAARVLREANPDPDAQTLGRHLLRLNEAALAAEDQIVLLDEPSRIDVRLHLFDLEQAAARLIALVSAGTLRDRHWDWLRLAGERLHHGRTSRGRPSVLVSDPVLDTLHALTRAAAGLEAASSRAVTASADPVPAPPPPPGPLAWRSAAQVTLASLAAMLGGMALSPQRWFWAVITVYVVFLNTRTRGDTIYKGSHRVAGTLAGLFGGLLVAISIEGNHAAECAIMLTSVFGIFYFYAVSYSVAIFCVTVLLGMVYGMLGTPLEQLLTLRLEETAIGVVAAGLAATFIWPTPTHHQVRLSGLAVLRALREVVQASVSPQAGGDAIAAVRRLDRAVADLRLALVPLSAGRALLRRGRAERPVTALLACAEAARGLAASAPGTCVRAEQAARAMARIEALLTGAPAPPRPDASADDAMSRLERALAMLSERLETNGADGFALD